MTTQTKTGAGEPVPQDTPVDWQALAISRYQWAIEWRELAELAQSESLRIRKEADGYFKQLAETKAQRDELLAALERIASDKEFTHRVNDEFIRKVWYVEEAKRAISQATGRAQ